MTPASSQVDKRRSQAGKKARILIIAQTCIGNAIATKESDKSPGNNLRFL